MPRSKTADAASPAPSIAHDIYGPSTRVYIGKQRMQQQEEKKRLNAFKGLSKVNTLENDKFKEFLDTLEPEFVERMSQPQKELHRRSKELYQKKDLLDQFKAKYEEVLPKKKALLPQLFQLHKGIITQRFECNLMELRVYIHEQKMDLARLKKEVPSVWQEFQGQHQQDNFNEKLKNFIGFDVEEDQKSFEEYSAIKVKKIRRKIRRKGKKSSSKNPFNEMFYLKGELSRAYYQLLEVIMKHEKSGDLFKSPQKDVFLAFYKFKLIKELMALKKSNNKRNLEKKLQEKKSELEGQWGKEIESKMESYEGKEETVANLKKELINTIGNMIHGEKFYSRHPQLIKKNKILEGKKAETRGLQYHIDDQLEEESKKKIIEILDSTHKSFNIFAEADSIENLKIKVNKKKEIIEELKEKKEKIDLALEKLSDEYKAIYKPKIDQMHEKIGKNRIKVGLIEIMITLLENNQENVKEMWNDKLKEYKKNECSGIKQDIKVHNSEQLDKEEYKKQKQEFKRRFNEVFVEPIFKLDANLDKTEKLNALKKAQEELEEENFALLHKFNEYQDVILLPSQQINKHNNSLSRQLLEVKKKLGSIAADEHRKIRREIKRKRFFKKIEFQFGRVVRDIIRIANDFVSPINAFLKSAFGMTLIIIPNEIISRQQSDPDEPAPHTVSAPKTNKQKTAEDTKRPEKSMEEQVKQSQASHQKEEQVVIVDVTTTTPVASTSAPSPSFVAT